MTGVSNELNGNAVQISQLASDSLKKSDKTLGTMRDTQVSLSEQESLVEQFLTKLVK